MTDLINSILTVAPLRISFVGGGTDFASFYKKGRGKVVSTTINKYVYVFLKRHDPTFGEKFRISYSEVEHVNTISEIQNNIIRECLKFLNFDEPLHISTLADLPAGSGLGSSSSFTTALLLGLHKMKGESVTKHQLAEEACRIEIEILGQPLGKQDQYAASFGGFNCFEFLNDNSVLIQPIKLSPSEEIELMGRSFLIFTNQVRTANMILKDQENRVNINELNLQRMYELATNFHVNCQNVVDWRLLRDIISEGWNLKKSFSPKIEIIEQNHLLTLVSKYFECGFKILGAGGGGFVYVMKSHVDQKIPPEISSLKSLVFPKIDHLGTRVVVEF